MDGSIDDFTNHDPNLQKDFRTLVEELRDARFWDITTVNFSALYACVEEINEDISLYRDTVRNTIPP